MVYIELVDKVYKRIDIDRFKYDLKLKSHYAMGTIPMEPALLKDDVDVMYYTKHKNRKRFPLCVRLVSKEIIASSAN